MKIYGNHSPYPVIADADVVEKLGGPEAAFHEIKRINGYKIQLNTGAVAIVKPDEIKQ